MADVSRLSTFPPILRSYHSGVFTSSEPFRALHAAVQSPTKPPVASKIGGGAESHRRRSGGPPSGKGGRKGGGGGESSQQTGSSSGLLSTDKIRREHEMEIRRKRNQRAEATLMCWDALLEEHRLQKHQTLQRRVGIQRDLITKNDQLFTELRKKDEEERLGKIQARKSAQKKLAESLRSHVQKVEEHKKKIAEKFDMLKSEEQLEDNVSDDVIQTTSSSNHHGQTQDEAPHTEGENRRNISAQKELSNSVNQMLGCDHSKQDTRAVLESLWGGKKSATNRQLRPIIQYSDQLKQDASPSVKQCLEIYERPTAHDRYTGKAIPLCEILHDIINKAEMGTSHSNWNNAIELMSKHMQKRAQALLRRKDPYNSLDPSLSSNEGWFTELCGESEDRVRAKTASASVDSIGRKKHKDTLLHKRAKSSGTTVEMKKKLPTFLTPDGELLKSSLEEFGSQLFCGPSSKNDSVAATHTDVGSGGQSSKGSSVFLTDLQNNDYVENVPIEPKSSKKRAKEPRRRDVVKQTAEAVAWQPLSLGALAEHSTVTELPVRGLGEMAHGKYSMWKPGQSFSITLSD